MFTDTTGTEQRILPSRQDKNGAFLIDRSPTYFEPLLNYLRHGQIILDTNVNAAGMFITNFIIYFISYMKFFDLNCSSNTNCF